MLRPVRTHDYILKQIEHKMKSSELAINVGPNYRDNSCLRINMPEIIFVLSDLFGRTLLLKFG